jgi:hypothetical protein
MNNFSPEETQRKDLLSSLTLWLVAEFVAFVIFPATEVIKVSRSELNGWFLTSLPLGLGGVLLFALTSRFLALAHNRDNGNGKDVLVLLNQVGGFVAMLGVVYPLIVTLQKFFS